ncbi:MAG TPA: glycosyltransferase [Nitrososphaeraceae archaeon]
MHVSHESLPDWRIEKSAITASNRGNDVFFAGKLSNDYSRKSFAKIYKINWNAKARLGLPYYSDSIKKQLDQVLKETKPDVIHAHNIFSAKMVSEFGIPFVYDDHEYWSRLSQLLREIARAKDLDGESTRHKGYSKLMLTKATNIRRSLINSYAIKLWTKWEQEIVSSHPTITVSEQIATDLRTNYNAKDVFVVPNFPMFSEVRDFEKPLYHDSLSSVYAGGDGNNIDKYPNRDIDNLDTTFLQHGIGDLVVIGWSAKSPSIKVRYTGFLPRQEMYREMFNHSIGLVPFKRHWSHAFVSPNKAYEYAHAGLAIVCTFSFAVIKEILKEHCITFEDYEDMASKLKYFKENLDELYKRRLRIFEFARENLIWEKNESSIIEAYRKCT